MPRDGQNSSMTMKTSKNGTTESWPVQYEAHPLVSEWVRQRRAVGDTGLHRFWPTTHAALDHGVPRLLLGHEKEADLAEKVAECRHKDKSWDAIYRMLQKKGQLLRDKKGV